jgi:hypothetical protein
MLPAITVVERIPLPDLRRPERTPSLPGWVASRIASLKNETQPHPTTGEYRETPTLPASLILGQAEREEINRHLAELENCYGPTPADDPQAEEATLVVVTKMMLVLPTMTQNEASAEARGEAFMAVLDDLPTWTVAAAVRRWYRGDAGRNERGEPYDCHWCPAPAELRSIATMELWRVKGRAKMLGDLLRAEPLIEYSDEHRSAMRARLSKLMQFSPVGKDGSGGKVNAD